MRARAADMGGVCAMPLLSYQVAFVRDELIAERVLNNPLVDVGRPSRWREPAHKDVGSELPVPPMHCVAVFHRV